MLTWNKVVGLVAAPACVWSGRTRDLRRPGLNREWRPSGADVRRHFCDKNRCHHGFATTDGDIRRQNFASKSDLVGGVFWDWPRREGLYGPAESLIDNWFMAIFAQANVGRFHECGLMGSGLAAGNGPKVTPGGDKKRQLSKSPIPSLCFGESEAGCNGSIEDCGGRNRDRTRVSLSGLLHFATV